MLAQVGSERGYGAVACSAARLRAAVGWSVVAVAFPALSLLVADAVLRLLRSRVPAQT